MMTYSNLTIQLHLDEADILRFKGADLFLIPHSVADREDFVANMAALEKFIEGAGSAAEIAAFQAVGGFLFRAKLTGWRRADA